MEPEPMAQDYAAAAEVLADCARYGEEADVHHLLTTAESASELANTPNEVGSKHSYVEHIAVLRALVIIAWRM
jgi:hypothetical protein